MTSLSCDSVRPSLGRVAEGDATPEQALTVGRHVQDCTACRIRLARERRLAEMVAGLDDPIDVEESFLEQVMDELPSVPSRRRLRFRRGIKLAGVVLALGAVGAAGAMGGGDDGMTLATLAGPIVDEAGARVVGDLGQGLVGAATTLAEATVRGESMHVAARPLAVGAALAAPLVAAAVVAGTAVVLAAARLARAL